MSLTGKKKSITKKGKPVKVGSRETSKMGRATTSAPSKITSIRPTSPCQSSGTNRISEMSRRKKGSTRKASRGTTTNNNNTTIRSAAFFETADGKKYSIVNHFRNPGSHAEFFVKNEEGATHMLRFEPSNRAKLKYLSEVLMETKKAAGEEKAVLVQSIEYGTSSALGLNYLILSPYGLQIVEVLKIVKKFTPGCALNVALQCLEAIRYLHLAGFVNRNIKPGTFSIGHGDQESRVLLTDFRLTRTHLESSTKKARKPRPSVPYCGTARYASIAGLKEKEQGRRDDLESWMYMLYELLDPEGGLSWKRMPRCNMLIREKENFKAHVLPGTYKIVPEEFKKLVDTIHALTYDSTPDYAVLKDIVEKVAKAKSFDLTACDWTGKITPELQTKAVEQAQERSTGNRCSGADDFEHGKKKASRKIMNPDDTIKNGQFTWKVVNLLGSGGFGDVYKVYDEKNKNKHYALKTESDEGKKVMLRLKVEMQVLMAITEARKTDKTGLKHFVEFVDRGKSEDLRCKFIVMSLVGPSLDDCRKKYGVHLNSKQTPYIIAIQSLEAVRDLHNLGYLHRDIKPANFAVGFGPEEPYVFMLDFGIGRSYLDPKTKEHRAPRKSVKFLGTLRYASRACMKGIDQGRKDDLECWIYMVFDIFDPDEGCCWKEVRGRDAITQSKDYFFEFKIDKVYDNIPREMKSIVSYVNSLQFQSTPDYEHLINRLHRIADQNGFAISNMRGGCWVGRLKNPKQKTHRFDDSDSESEHNPSESEGD